MKKNMKVQICSSALSVIVYYNHRQRRMVWLPLLKAKPSSWALLLRAVTIPFFFVGGCKSEARGRVTSNLKSMGSLVKLVAPLGDNQKPRKDSVTNVSTHHVTNLLHSLMVDDQGKDVTIISSEGEHTFAFY